MEQLAILLASAIVGLIVGSFLNVVILRYNTGKSLNGRSMCLSCKRQLKWEELIPVISFIWQGGRCKGCSSKISFQYVVVEIITAVVFVLIALQAVNIFEGYYPFASLRFFIWNAGIASLLLVIAFYDLRHKIIPNELVYSFMILAVATPFIVDASLAGREMVWALHGVYSGGILFGLFWLLWHFSKGRLMGFGDAKLVFGIGLWLGIKVSLLALLVAFVSGAVVGLSLIVIGPSLPTRLKSFSMKSEIPFAPFLVLGAIIGFVLAIHGTPLAS